MRYLIIFFCICLPFSGSAQMYREIASQSGLDNRKIYRIHQDPQGYMWFLTNDGVERFNGKDVKHYELTDGARKIRPQANSDWIYPDRTGCLWLIGRKGRVFRYNKTHDRFNMQYKLPGLDSKDPAAQLTYGFMDSHCHIWFCDKDSITLYDTSENKVDAVLDNRIGTITSIEQTGDTDFYIGTDHGLYHLVMDARTWQPKSCRPVGNMRSLIREIHYHPYTQKLFVGTLNDGIWAFDLKNPTDTRPHRMRGDADITRIVTYNDEEVLIATNGQGVFRMNALSGEVEPYITANYNSFNELNVNNFNDVFVDDQQRIWLISYPGGITIRDNRYPGYKWIKHSVGNKRSLINDQVYDILEDSDGDLWFGTGNGVSLYRKSTRTWHNYLSSFDDEPMDMNHTFKALCEVSPDIIWVGGYTKGIHRIDKRTSAVKDLTPDLVSMTGLKADRYIKDICVDSDGCIWTGGFHTLKCFDPKSRSAKQYDGLGNINALLEKEPGQMWIGTATGLFLLDKRSGKVQSIDFPTESMSVCALCQTENHTLYIGTDGAGLWLYDTERKTFIQYHTENSALISNKIYCILKRPDNHMLLSTENGVVLYSIRDKAFRNLTKEQGLRSTCFNAGAGILCRDGNCILGSNNGVIILPADLRIPTPAFSGILLSDFQISYSPVYPGDPGSPLERDINETERLKLNYAQNTFSLKVSTVNYDYPSNILYSWKLDGVWGWSAPEPGGRIRFTGLNSGHYTLHVRAVSGEDPRHVFEERTLKIYIARPPWLSGWAIAGYVLAAAAAVYGVYRILSMRKQKRIAEEKTKFMISTAHEIRTPLTLIKSPLEELVHKKPLDNETRSYLSMALNNVQSILRQTTNLINFERTNIYSSQLYVSEYELNAYLKGICDSFRPSAYSKQIRLDCRCGFSFLNVGFDRDKMDSILNNLISYAIKHTPERGRVSVVAAALKDTWSIEVRYSGDNLSAKERKWMFRPCLQVYSPIQLNARNIGIGLALVKKLVCLHKGKLTLERKPGEWTSIRLYFPKKMKRTRRVSFLSKIGTSLPALLPERHASAEADAEETKRQETANLPETSAYLPRIMVVEENDDLRTYLTIILKDTFLVKAYRSGKEALGDMKEYLPRLVLADSNLSEMRGDELCREIKNDLDLSHIPVVLLTALNDEKNIMESLKVGADDYIIKPFSVDFLIASLQNVLKNRELLRKKYGNPELEDDPEWDCLNPLDRKFMKALKECVTQNIGNPNFNVDSLSGAMHMSRTSLFNKMKALLDDGPSNYIKELRLQHAAHLLIQGGRSITEISELCGFSDVKYFREVFKKRFEVSPTEYARSKGKK